MPSHDRDLAVRRSVRCRMHFVRYSSNGTRRWFKDKGTALRYAVWLRRMNYKMVVYGRAYRFDQVLIIGSMKSCGWDLGRVARSKRKHRIT